jgi:hypothetical protein
LEKGEKFLNKRRLAKNSYRGNVHKSEFGAQKRKNRLTYSFPFNKKFTARRRELLAVKRGGG